MRTHVEFRSSEFPAEPGEDEQVNPGRHGRLLATYIRDQLAACGLATREPLAEDWGWLVPIENPNFPLWVGCGNYEEYPDGFLCFIEPSRPTIRRLFRKIDTTAVVDRVSQALGAALQSHPGIRDVRWWSETDARV